MTPLVAALVRAVVFLLKKTPHTDFACANRVEWHGSEMGTLCEPCRLLRDVEREAES